MHACGNSMGKRRRRVVQRLRQPTLVSRRPAAFGRPTLAGRFLRFPQRRRRAVSASNGNHVVSISSASPTATGIATTIRDSFLPFSFSLRPLLRGVAHTRGSGRGRHASAIFDAPVVQLRRRRVEFCMRTLIEKAQEWLCSTPRVDWFIRLRACSCVQIRQAVLGSAHNGQSRKRTSSTNFCAPRERVRFLRLKAGT